MCVSVCVCVCVYVCVFLTAPSLILWQMVSLGIKGLFEMVKETWRSHPELCKKALQSFFELLQGLDPERLEQEPEEVIGKTALSVCVRVRVHVLACMPGTKATVMMQRCSSSVLVFCFLPDALNQLLLDMVNEQVTVDNQTANEIASLAVSCLVALVLSRGEPHRMLRAISAIITGDEGLVDQNLQVCVCVRACVCMCAWPYFVHCVYVYVSSCLSALYGYMHVCSSFRSPRT